MQTNAANAYPANLSCWNPHHKRVVWNILCDHGAGGYKTVPTQYNTADDGRIRSDGCALSHKGSFELVLPFDATAWIDYIRKNHGWPTENIVFKLYPRIHRDVILDLYPVTDRDTGANYNILTEVTVAPDPGASHDMTEMPNPCSGADFAAAVDYCCGINEILCRCLI